MSPPPPQVRAGQPVELAGSSAVVIDGRGLESVVKDNVTTGSDRQQWKVLSASP
ncbi:hypothetical protein [Streptomyces sp. NPDC002573]|uniref:hypothetical protein n=1 Tax=Streptomyces sp. NPDC002573 TaxID=3364651 RepID=UPI00368B4AFD